MTILKITKYLNFTEISNTGKTKIVGVGNNNGEKLGYIRWRSGWRKYVFEPLQLSVWDESCLLDICIFLKELMDERKNINS